MLTSRRPHQCISVLWSLLFLYLRHAYSYAYDYACLLASLERTGLCFSTSDDRRVDIVEIPLKPYKPTFGRQENIYDWNTCSLFIYFDTLKFQLYNVIIATIEQLLRRLPTLELWINKMHLLNTTELFSDLFGYENVKSQESNEFTGTLTENRPTILWSLKQNLAD